jgi:hypothetical protein
MSRSNNTEIVNPAKRYYQWVGSKGCLRYFDKTKGEKGEDVFVKLPFTFLVLDRLHTIRGFSDADQSGYWSNEVRDLKLHTLTVRNKKGIAATGLYASLAPVLNKGANYCQSVYIAIKGADGKLEICNVQLEGSSIGPWIELCKGKDIYKYAVSIASATPMKKGTTNYFAPVFSLSANITPETENAAQELDKELQEYLKSYFLRNNTQQRENVKETEVVIADNSNGNGGIDIDEVNTALHQDASTMTVPLDDLPF